ncbi:MAG: NAD(P)-dependent oxidoreductase [Betaproteobacteria bacterium]|nr:NAD(P)-dependent oxidoreductase [Betaproteobacteria bacterium]
MAKQMIGIVGLGIMGGAMAEALLAAGHKVVGFDVAPAAKARLRKAGGRALGSAAAMAQNADIVITSLPSVAALDDVITKIAGAKRGNRKEGLVVIEMSTLPIADKERTRAMLAKAKGVMLDCPISGTAARLSERTWSIYVSGPTAACERVDPVLAVFTDLRPYVGSFGDGTKMKFIANHLVAIYNVAYGETMTFARKMGLNAKRVYDLMANSPVLGTGVFKLRGAQMVKRQYTPATMKIDIWQKDMQVIGDMAKAVNCPVPLFTACVPIYTTAMAMGLAKQDTAAACEVIGAMAGVRAKKKR